jgi:non-ribosomal peptide synthetase component F
MIGTDLRRGLLVEANERQYLVIEVPNVEGDAAGTASPRERAVRLLVERVQALAHDLGRAEQEREALRAEIARLAGATAAAQPDERAQVRRQVETSWAAPRQLRSRRTSPFPTRLRWPAWRH